MSIVIKTPADFNLVECVNSHGWRSLAPFSWNAETKTLERIECFDSDGAALVAIRAAEGGLNIDVIGDAPNDEVVKRVRRMLQLDLPMDGFHSFCAGHVNLEHIPARRQGRMLRCPSLFEDVVKVVATTNTTWSQTKAMTARIVENFGTPLSSDPARKAFPSPARIAAAPLTEFSDKAKMGYRNTAVHRIATEIAEGRLDLDAFEDATIPSADLFKQLLSLPGVGPYAASCLMIYLGRYDRVNVDSWARMMVGKELGRAVTDKEAHEFFATYGDWKALVYHFYNWKEAEPEY